MISYEEFCSILNKHIFEKEKTELLTKLAEKPERFIGLFRPSKPATKILQHILQAHEIKMGDALEEIITKIIHSLGYEILNQALTSDLKLDLYFTDSVRYYFVEQKIRDDHDSTKKRGQIENFQRKLEHLYNLHGGNTVGIMYFIDPDFSKNKQFYQAVISKLIHLYNTEIYLFYGKEFFDYLKCPECWESMVEYLVKWKNTLSDLPEVNFDKEPLRSFEEIKDVDIKIWEKILNKNELWEEGIIKAIFKTGETLKLLLEYFHAQSTLPNKRASKYTMLAKKLESRMIKYYPKLVNSA